ncbi:MAG: acireductone synthase [Gammaproteobacteria bacterium]
MIKAVVTDIEGTTSSLAFVKDTLFPYARARIGEFVRSREHDPEIAAILNDARISAGDATMPTEKLIEQLHNWIDQDLKITALKSLQGLIWEYGYQQGDFKGHVYLDTVRQLEAWKRTGLALYVYSSGSVHAQKLLFGHTDFGDLTALFEGYFDTAIGGKKEQESYRRIAERVGRAAADILFLSDILEELDAAKAAGMKTCHLIREGSRSTTAGHDTAIDFYGISVV